MTTRRCYRLSKLTVLLPLSQQSISKLLLYYNLCLYNFFVVCIVCTNSPISIASKWWKQWRDVIGDRLSLLVRVRVGAAVDLIELVL